MEISVIFLHECLQKYFEKAELPTSVRLIESFSKLEIPIYVSNPGHGWHKMNNKKEKK